MRSELADDTPPDAHRVAVIIGEVVALEVHDGRAEGSLFRIPEPIHRLVTEELLVRCFASRVAGYNDIVIAACLAIDEHLVVVTAAVRRKDGDWRVRVG